ncbi:hypothetical protein DYB30_014044 [Aphanomyces astaci]|uniref:CLASP N-terminal domain-containing protein n=3 Tax=Aphanomyces astaci TaxID=112090 RepID=A0A397CRQ6_APHAT|nr:hypothetical protein DYB30_014044 [Aphanomyces astaci]
MNTIHSVKLAAMDFLHELKLSAKEVLLTQLHTQTRRLVDALQVKSTDDPDSWRVQLRELAGVQRLLDTLDNTSLDVDSKASVATCLLPVAAPINDLITSTRSEVVRKACGAVAQFASMTGPAFAPFANQVLASLVHTAKIKTFVMSHAGQQCLLTVSSMSRYDLTILLELWGSTRAAWPKSEVAEHYTGLLALVTSAMDDRNDHVRMAARQAFCVFVETWSEHIQVLVEVPSARHRPLFMAEHASARLTAELVKIQGTPRTTAARVQLRRPLRTASAPRRKANELPQAAEPVHNVFVATQVVPDTVVLDGFDGPASVELPAAAPWWTFRSVASYFTYLAKAAIAAVKVPLHYLLAPATTVHPVVTRTTDDKPSQVALDSDMSASGVEASSVDSTMWTLWSAVAIIAKAVTAATMALRSVVGLVQRVCTAAAMATLSSASQEVSIA